LGKAEKGKREKKRVNLLFSVGKKKKRNSLRTAENKDQTNPDRGGITKKKKEQIPSLTERKFRAGSAEKKKEKKKNGFAMYSDQKKSYCRQMPIKRGGDGAVDMDGKGKEKKKGTCKP